MNKDEYIRMGAGGAHDLEFQDDFQIRIDLSSFKKPERLGERIAF